MKTSNRGLASIPLILGLAIMVFSTAMAINLSNRNQNLQNRAATEDKCLSSGQKGCFTTGCCPGLICSQDTCQAANKPLASDEVPCNEMTKYYNQFCAGLTSDTTLPNHIPCKDVQSVIAQYCSATHTTSVIPTFSSKPKITPTTAPKKPTPIICQTGQIRTIGRITMSCTDGHWTFKALTPTTGKTTK